MLWLFSKFVLVALSILYLGRRLTFCGQRLSDKTGISTMLVGALFLSIATSLPELATSFAAAFAVHSIPLAIGDIMGSVVVNMIALSLAVMALAHPNILEDISAANKALVKYLLFILLIMAAGFIFPSEKLFPGWIGLESFIIAIVYVVAVNSFRISEVKTSSEKLTGGSSRLWIEFFIMLIVMSGLGYFVALLCDELSLKTNISRSFIGATFLAIATSLPEITITVWALKRGQINMAFGNIIGSNAFNCFIYPMIDGAYGRGPIGIYATKANGITIILAAVLCGLLVLGISRAGFRRLFGGYGFFSIIAGCGLAGYVLIFISQG